MPFAPGTDLPGLQERVDSALQAAEADSLVPRIWARDHTVWSKDPTEIADRLGWLTVAGAMRSRIPEMEAVAAGCGADGLTTVLLAGMGGSSLAPEVFRDVLPPQARKVDLVVLDTTHPEELPRVERARDPRATLNVIASKSGTTVETLSHLAYLWERDPDGSRYLAITDPGTPLEEIGRTRDFRQVFLNPPDIGGRYSALSLFGLAHAALLGSDLRELIHGAEDMAERCGPSTPPRRNPGAWLGVALGEAALAGRDKLTLVLPEWLRALGPWLEQLIAESTGKQGKGIVPVEGEGLGEPSVYGSDRLFVAVGLEEGAPERAALARLGDAGHPVVHLQPGGSADLGAELFRWEFATAVAGAVLDINPFDQPNVQEAKDATKRVLEGGRESPSGQGDPGEVLASAGPGDYLCIQAYLPRDPAIQDRLQVVRMRIRDRLGVATTLGFGPRFLHSTGQLHKGGPNSGLFLQVVEPVREDVEIPGAAYTFGELIAAQADGDLASLRAAGRRVARLSMADLERLASG